MGPILLLAVAFSSANPGFIWVKVSPGHSILVDGALAGQSTADERGLIVEKIAPGKHEVRVVDAEGHGAVFEVDVAAGQMVTVTVPTLAFRAKMAPADATVEIHLMNNSGPPCPVTLDTRTQMTAQDAVFDSVPPGQHQLTLFCTSPAIESTLTVVERRTMKVEVDVAKRQVHVIDQHPRPRALHVDTAPDALTNSDLPAHWKRALVSSMPGGVHAKSISRGGPFVVSGIFTAPDVSTAINMLYRLHQQAVVRDVGLLDIHEHEDGSAEISIQIKFNS